MNLDPKPYSAACDRNKDPILEVLKQHLAAARSVLEIGSGTGQHAVHFAKQLPHLLWQCSDRAENLPGISAWLNEACLPNTPPPMQLDVTGTWPVTRFDAVYSANTLHIMSWQEVETFFGALPGVVQHDATLTIYGPFRYAGRHTSASNAAFDASLRQDVPHRGIRDFEAVDELAKAAGFALLADHAMPANNRCLVWKLDAKSPTN
ncbi:DUF938 domain-containing protein [Azoarcus taiwanensis]|uniref:DUF938 domain-containing protein n=1 Tax=Azoarcus taiwanensis TaxID=666964 RepID=A0A972FFT4_9RHOO|nr:DUF938 domain-containing protein [Azoarcus taiwanensis]